MEQNTTSNRLHALDGIRGLAILLVVLNHVDSTYISNLLPSWISQIIFGSGVTGVSLLFILSGFLMAYLYANPTNGLHFLQKRYTRIFPLFLTMCSVTLLLRNSPGSLWYLRLLIIISLTLMAHSLWIFIKRFAHTKMKQYIFRGFILLQILVGGFYLFWVMKQPAIVFNQQIPSLLREGTIGLVNGTLTLPLGDYIPMLDGVYWSLAAEIFFYILYPFVCVPLVHYFIPKKRWVKITVILTLIPFFAGMDILSHRIFVLSMFQLPLCYYFVTGISLGYVYKHHTALLQKTSSLFPGFLYYASILLFFFILFIKLSILQLSPSLDPLIHILWAFPITFIMAIALDHKTALSKMLSSRPLVYLGTISYSIYLSHTPILHMVQDTYKATTTFDNIIVILITLLLTFVVSIFLYHMLEKPYFKRSKEKIPADAYQEHSIERFIRRPAFLFSAIVFLYIFSIFSAYQSNFNFFSIEYPFSSKIFVHPQITPQQKTISMLQYPKVDMHITPQQNNFEILAMHITHSSDPHKRFSNQMLIFHIKQIGQKMWSTTNSYKVNLIGDSKEHPFGFPLIQQAKGNTYDVELAMAKPNTSDYITIHTTDGATKGVYQVDKIQLLKHPASLISFISAKVSAVWRNTDAQKTFYLFVPMVILIILLQFPKKRDVYISRL